MSPKIMATAGLAATLAAFAPSGPAGAATTVNDLSVASCTTGANCSSETITGTLTSVGTYAVPWEIQVGSDPGQCLRLETTFASGLDLEMVAVSPSGAVYRDDDGGAGLLSLLKIAPTEKGWYTVQVSSFDGGAAAVNFTLRYGRYVAGNLNCVAPTPPVLSAARERAK